MSLEDAAEELASDLGADTAEVREKLETLQSYSVPLEEAKGSIRREFGPAAGEIGRASCRERV